MTWATERRFREQLRQAPVYAVLRAADADRFLEVAEVLLEAGVSSIELTLTTPGALTSLAALRAALPRRRSWASARSAPPSSCGPPMAPEPPTPSLRTFGWT
jgi:hypothetical protein